MNWLPLLSAFLFHQVDAPTAPLDVGNRAQLFIDRAVESLRFARRWGHLLREDVDDKLTTAIGLTARCYQDHRPHESD